MKAFLVAALGLLVAGCAPWPAEPRATPTGDARAVGGDASPEPLQAVLDRALGERLGAAATFRVEESKREAGWLFACGTPLTPAGGSIDYRATSLRERAAAGMVDDHACALARERSGRWEIEELAVGDTDAGFVDWPAKHGAPASILAPG